MPGTRPGTTWRDVRRLSSAHPRADMTWRSGARTQQMRLDERLTFVIRGLVPRIALRRAQCAPKRDGRNKSGHDAVGLRAGMTKNETRRVRRKWPSQNSDSIVKQPAPAARQAPSPVLFDRGPGQAGLSCPLAKRGGWSTARRTNTISALLGRGVRPVRRTRPAALHLRLFCPRRRASLARTSRAF